MIRIKTKVDGGHVLTLKNSDKWYTLVHREDGESYSTVSLSLLDAGEEHIKQCLNLKEFKEYVES